MLKTLNKHQLDPHKALIYVKDQLNGGNTLSKCLLEELDFGRGQFYTYLPSDADLGRLYDFFGGEILHQNSIREKIDEFGKKSYYTLVPTIKNEISAYITSVIELKKSYACFFEDVVCRLGDPHLDFFNLCGVSYHDELYYFIDEKNVSVEKIRQAINEINSLWHLVFILTRIESSGILKEISLTDIKIFSQKIQLLVIGAYDGEGFIFWKPNNSSLPESKMIEHIRKDN